MKKIKSKEEIPNISDIFLSRRAFVKKKWDRVLPFNELLTDRWEKANFLKAKKGSSIYDNSYIFGNVSIGKDTWIGPFTILDGSGGKISIGNNCSISAGVQIYSHNSVKWALTGGKSRYDKMPVYIGNNCYLGPNSIISMGSKIGKCSVIGAHSLVKGIIKPYSIVFGNPGKVVGKVILNGNDIKFEYF